MLKNAKVIRLCCYSKSCRTWIDARSVGAHGIQARVNDLICWETCCLPINYRWESRCSTATTCWILPIGIIIGIRLLGQNLTIETTNRQRVSGCRWIGPLRVPFYFRLLDNDLPSVAAHRHTSHFWREIQLSVTQVDTLIVLTWVAHFENIIADEWIVCYCAATSVSGTYFLP